MEEIYHTEPLEIVDGIPVFCADDIYANNYDEIAADAIQSIEETGENSNIPEVLWRKMEDDTVRVIQKYIVRSTKKILDIGVGTGRLLSYITQKDSMEKYGIDISLGILKFAQGKNDIHLCKGRVESLPYKDGVFDMVLCTDVLEHVQDLYHAVLEIERVMRVGGVLVIRVPYKEELSMYFQKGYPYRFCHLRSFDEWEMKTLFTKISEMSFVKMEPSIWKVGRGGYNFKGGGGSSKKIHALLQRIYPKLQRNEKYLKKYYNPIEMIYVFRKIKSAGESGNG